MGTGLITHFTYYIIVTAVSVLSVCLSTGDIVHPFNYLSVCSCPLFIVTAKHSIILACYLSYAFTHLFFFYQGTTTVVIDNFIRFYSSKLLERCLRKFVLLLLNRE